MPSGGIILVIKEVRDGIDLLAKRPSADHQFPKKEIIIGIFWDRQHIIMSTFCKRKKRAKSNE
jgi:hypothetical protein